MMNSKTGSIYSPEQMTLDLRNIIASYKKEGFLNVHISRTKDIFNSDSTKIDISFNIIEGKRYTVGEIRFEGNKKFTAAYLIKQMYTKAGSVLEAAALNRDIEQLLSIYEKAGFIFASIEVKEISGYTDLKKIPRILIVISVNENEKVRIDKVVIEGNTSTKTNVILRELRISKKAVTVESLYEIKKKLDNLGFFSNVEQPKIVKYKNSTVMLIKVTEGSTNTFDGIVGYVPPASDEDKGYFTGLVNLSLRNLFGTGRKIEARWQKEQQQTQELELKYMEPWLLSLPLNINLSFIQRVQDSTYVKRSFNTKSDLLISSSFSASLLTQYERVIPGEQNYSGVAIFNSRVLGTGFEIKLDTRDYIYNPLFGLLYRTTYSIGQKKVYNNDEFKSYSVPRDFTVHRFQIDLDFYHSFFNRQSTLISIHGGEVRSPKLENADYFRFGGIKTVRGYREEQFLASRVVWSNVEIRYLLTRRTFAAIFYDAGYYWKPGDDITGTPKQNAFIYGYGAGLRFETPLGIFGVSYALGKGDSILEGKVHFGLINEF
jgi:outer membrane protein insertion porin family